MEVPFFGKISIKGVLHDPTAIALLFANIFSIILAVVFNWNFFEIFLVFWTQNCIIGFFHFFKILFAKNFSLEGQAYSYTGSGKQKVFMSSKEIKLGNFSGALFFAFVYAFAHIIYFLFIMFFLSFNINNFFGYGQIVDFNQVFGVFAKNSFLLAVAIFFVAHLFSFIYYLARERDYASKYGSEDFFGEPFSRVLPMHLTIIALGFIGFIFISPNGAVNFIALIIFLLLKTLFDLASHLRKHLPKPKNWLEEFEQNNPPTTSQ